MCDICSRAVREQFPEWSNEESTQALLEGWDLFTTDRDPASEVHEWKDGKPYGHHPFELQYYVDLEEDTGLTWPFSPPGDQAAMLYVVRRALDPDGELHRKALRFLARYSPRELECIQYYAAEAGVALPTL